MDSLLLALDCALGLELCMLDWGGGKGVAELCMVYWYGALGLDELCMLVSYGANGLEELVNG